jgi:hypothetical protein
MEGQPSSLPGMLSAQALSNPSLNSKRALFALRLFDFHCFAWP